MGHRRLFTDPELEGGKSKREVCWKDIGKTMAQKWAKSPLKKKSGVKTCT
jgi:hypothetical protein